MVEGVCLKVLNKILKEIMLSIKVPISLVNLSSSATLEILSIKLTESFNIDTLCFIIQQHAILFTHEHKDCETGA